MASTSYQAVRNRTETSKRYRIRVWSGREVGSTTMGEVLLILARTLDQCRPIGIGDGINLYRYSKKPSCSLT